MSSQAILHIVNQSGGGTMRYIESLIHASTNPHSQFVWYVGAHQHILFDVQTPYYYAFSADLPHDRQQLLILSVISHTGSKQIGLHLHSFFGQALSVAENWSNFPIVATFHDHHFVSEMPFREMKLYEDSEHIVRVKSLLAEAEIIVPSNYLYTHASKHFPKNQLHVIEHGVESEEIKPLTQATKDFVATVKARAGWEMNRFTVATIGAINQDKGLNFMLDLFNRGDDMQFVCIGYTGDIAADKIRPQAKQRHIMHAFYHHAEVPELLSLYGVNVVIFLPGIPESFCYALSDIAGKVPVLAPRHGALGERVISEQLGLTYEPESSIDELYNQMGNASQFSVPPIRNTITVEIMAMKTEQYYRHKEIESVLDETLTADQLSELLADQLHSDNLKWELASLVRQNFVLTDDIAHVKKDLERRDAEFKQQDVHIKTQQNYIEELEDSVSFFKENIAGLKEHIENHENHNKKLANQLYIIQNSLSWRITKPIRAIHRLFNK